MDLTADDFTIVDRSQTWRIVGDTHYRVCTIRTHDGRLLRAGIRDDVASAAQ